MTRIEIDGSEGEGGGQILRSSLALSVITGRPVRFTQIRAHRRKPGLRRQHLTAVRAAAEISGATVVGDELDSLTLEFTPGAATPGHYHFDVGTAGSTTLVLQTVLWPLLAVDGESVVTIVGGTHNPLAPSFEFMERCLLEHVRSMGAEVELRLERVGFYPAGGGRIVARICGGATLRGLELGERGSVIRTSARALVSALPMAIANRELRVVGHKLNWPKAVLVPEEVDSDGPGNVLLLEIEHDAGTSVFTAVGQKGIPAEDVASNATREADAFINADVAVDTHLADQLLIPLALAGGGRFVTTDASQHTTTNAAIIARFLAVEVDLQPEPGLCTVEVRPRSAS